MRLWITLWRANLPAERENKMSYNLSDSAKIELLEIGTIALTKRVDNLEIKISDLYMKQQQDSVQPEVKPEIAEVIKMINEEWRIVDGYDKTTPKDQYYKDRELAEYAKIVLEALREKVQKQFSV